MIIPQFKASQYESSWKEQVRRGNSHNAVNTKMMMIKRVIKEYLVSKGKYIVK